jgi:hypothetical protein
LPYLCEVKLSNFYIKTKVFMKKLMLLSMLMAFVAISAKAQIRTPAASPGCEFKQTVGLTDVTINYSRPSAKGRAVFGEGGIVPYNEMWRAGANSATKITFADAVTVGDQNLAAGAYAVLINPMAAEWQVMFYNYEGGSWGSYVEKSAVAKVMAPVKRTAAVETFTIAINNLQTNSATIDFSWGEAVASVPLKVEVDKRVMADIDRVMSGPSASDYYAAASYLHDSGRDLARALEYCSKANSMGEPRYWMLRREALILGDLGRYPDAIKVATRSMEMAEQAGDMNYVRMNKASIATWQAKR